MDHVRVLEQIVAWATADDNIRVVVLTGSAAIGPEHVHPLSDLDVELYVTRPATLLDHDAWYAQFGEILVVEALPNPGWHPTRLVYYVNGKIDFMVGPVGALATAKYARPFRVLLEKDHTTDTLPAAPPLTTLPPDAASFLECVHWFYAAALMCAKCVVRDEPWQAKVRDWDLKRELIRMIEWDHKARHGWSYDTWTRGKRLKQWIDADVLAALDSCWAGFGGSETAQAMLASVELFESLRTRTAQLIELPAFDARSVRAEVTAILERAGAKRIQPSVLWRYTT
jgi:aminoglycoside 6-adenylyltransferase